MDKDDVVVRRLVATDEGWSDWVGGQESPVSGDTRVMVTQRVDGVVTGPFLAAQLNWTEVTQYRRYAESPRFEALQRENAELRTERDDLSAKLDAMRTGTDSALNLQRLYTATADTREARALYNYAGIKLEHALLLEKIASSISRGHLSSDFHTKLREWSK
jgi:hypothetical protein